MSAQPAIRTVSLAEIAEVYRTSYQRFVRVAAVIAGGVEPARDIVQEAFAKAIRARAEFRGEARLESWLWRIVVNTARSERARAAELAGERVETLTAESRPMEGDEVVRALLRQLPERQRLVLFLRYYADLDYRTIGEVMEVAPGTVAATLNAAHANVHRLVEEVPE